MHCNFQIHLRLYGDRPFTAVHPPLVMEPGHMQQELLLVSAVDGSIQRANSSLGFRANASTIKLNRALRDQYWILFSMWAWNESSFATGGEFYNPSTSWLSIEVEAVHKMLYIWLIATYSLCCISIISIFLFGQLSFCRSRGLGHAYRFLAESLPATLRSCPRSSVPQKML